MVYIFRSARSDMSAPSSPTESEPKVYRFISDPGHKENLSGRVRAACLTCRRKKIKCSGETNCQTCREKGLVCEGFPERKRPRRHSSILEPVAGGGIKPRKKGSPRRSKVAERRTSTSSAKIVEAASGNESDGSVVAFSESSAGTPAAQEPSAVEPGHPQEHIVSASDPDLRHWGLFRELDEHLGTGVFNATASEVSESMNLNFLHSDLLTIPEHVRAQWPLDRPELGSSNANITMAAMTLGDQAPPVPAMDWSDLDPNALTRRQTVAFPLPVPNSFEDLPGPLAPQHSAFDDTALFQDSSFFAKSGMTPRARLTPGLTDFASWWHADGGVGGSMDQGQASATNKLHSKLLEVQQKKPTSCSDIPMQDSQSALHLPTSSLGEYDGQLFAWPER